MELLNLSLAGTSSPKKEERKPRMASAPG